MYVLRKIQRQNRSKKILSTFGHFKLGVQDRKIKMVFNTGGTWHWVTFEKLMMKIYEFL